MGEVIQISKSELVTRKVLGLAEDSLVAFELLGKRRLEVVDLGSIRLPSFVQPVMSAQ